MVLLIHQDPIELMKGFFILTKVNQCESVSVIKSHFSIVLDTIGMFQSVLKVNLGYGWGVGGKGRISQISVILSWNISVLVTSLCLCTSSYLELRIEPPLKH